MALVDIIRNAVKTADTITRSVQETVTFEAWIGQSGFGAPTYAPAQHPKALVEHRAHQRRLDDGSVIEVKAKLTILEVLADTAELDPDDPRSNPVDTRDKFTTANGTTGPIVGIDGMQDAGKGRPFLLEIALGSGGFGTR
jgi:hypothetical protein